MLISTSISGYFTATQAAEALGVSSHEVARLAREEKIKAKKVRNVLLIDAIDLQLYVTLHQGKGRPFMSSVAWAALWILSGLDAEWLSYQQRRRLKDKLQKISACDLVWQARNRSVTRRYRVSESFLKKLKSELILTGKSNDLFENTLTQQDQMIEGYTDIDYEILEQKYHMVEDTNGNVIIHVVQDETSLINMVDSVPKAVAAADLALSLDTRERQAGLQMLERLLSEYRSNRS